MFLNWVAGRIELLADIMSSAGDGIDVYDVDVRIT